MIKRENVIVVIARQGLMMIIERGEGCSVVDFGNRETWRCDRCGRASSSFASGGNGRERKNR